MPPNPAMFPAKQYDKGFYHAQKFLSRMKVALKEVQVVSYKRISLEMQDIIIATP